jgi:hypothetical protein
MFTRTRAVAIVVALAAALGAAGCGSKGCNDATPPVGTLNTSGGCTAQAGAPVTVSFHVCPLCDQGPASCIVHAENAAAGTITLEPVSEVCDPNSSCPIITAPSCTIPTLNCQFTAPATSSPVTVTIVTPTGQETFQLAVSGSGTSPVVCSL